jgi:hypothetical protein
MDALVIGKPGGLTTAVVRAMRRRWMGVLQATPADADGPERVDFLLAEAGEPPLVVVFDTAPYEVARELVGRAAVVVVDERRVAAAVPGTVHERTYAQRALFGRTGGRPLSVVTMSRAGGRWLEGSGRHGTVGPERAAAAVLRACDAAAASCR